nr:hypothetical protein [uncultured Anaerocolumna sp.]
MSETEGTSPAVSDLITVSRFTSGTNKKNLIKSFINLSYKQKKEFDYSASVKNMVIIC